MKITTLFNMQTTRWATIPLVFVLMLPHLHQTSAVGYLRGHSDPDIRYSRNRQSHDQVSYRNRDHSRPSTFSVDHVSRFQDNNQGPSSSTWNAQVAGSLENITNWMKFLLLCHNSLSRTLTADLPRTPALIPGIPVARPPSTVSSPGAECMIEAFLNLKLSI
ncbi:hypothetical protein SeLEV6574_g03502 [Synchytrium endobioticum]|uniref:Uncharacterized protein n=1 Tax=Synchytrium endobioticum TaxID=286115 RepID=A0A507D3H2_9FUNG|nr:hypothetical protein SeLEV6574_g03502 [Synchytrium endobioticum]